MSTLQVVIADQHGLDVGRLIRVIEENYESVNGFPVRVTVGQGQYIDGLPEGTLVIKDDVR